jgi:RNA-directed DNA polymerase
MIKGWFGYFQHAAPGVFAYVDGSVRRRLRAIQRKQEKRPGAGRCPSDHQRWPNAFFANEGLFTLNAAFALARHPR